ncbi:MAG: carbohydrate ABC transporter permease [Chloroflexota bacterium]
MGTVARDLQLEEERRRRRRRTSDFGYLGIVLVVLLVWAAPVLWTLVTSFKVRTDIFTIPPTILFVPTLESYIYAFTTRPVLAYLRDSFIIASAATAIALSFAIPGAYAYARLKFRFRNQLSFYLLFMQMIPYLGLILPFFVILTRLKWTDTYQGLVLVNLAVVIPTATWLMITYFQDLPREVEEAAAVDGATHWQAFYRVMLPQAYGGVAVTAIFTFLWVWNEFLFAVILSGSKVRPFTVGMYGFLQFEENLWGPLTATACAAMLPVIIVALLAQRHIIRGLTMGAVK